MSSTIARLIVPLTCALAALLMRYLFADQPLSSSTRQLDFLLLQLPYILLTLAALMALLSNHALEAGITLSLLCAYWLIQSFLQSPLNSQPASQIFYLLTVLSPTLIITYALLPQSSCLQLQGLLAILLTPLLVLVIAGLLAINQQLFLSTATGALQNGVGGGYLSVLSWTLYFVAISLCLGLNLYQQQSIHNSLLGCSLMSLITYGWIQLNSISAFMFSGMGLLLTVNLTVSLLQIGYRDDLTQIGNRRALQQTAKTLRGPYSVAMVDADYFKKINDQFGHDLGDQALRAIASLLKQSADGGKPFRYGGEEFCLLFKGKTEQQVLDALEACRQAIANYDMVVRDKQHRPAKLKQGETRRGAVKRKSNLRLTVSIGVASSDNTQYTPNHNPFDQVLKSADRALYRAKASDRNCIQAA
ncbi:GGDEF domain-containing protein [Porticoccaceae bacterium]|nr:GGDEF domain-containing protein [Porticoccaceae bacterium]